MATSITSPRNLREQYLVCKDLMTKSGLDNDDLTVWAEALQIEDGRLDKALRRSSSTRRRVQRCLEAIEIELITKVDLTGAGSEEKTIEENIEDQNTRLEIRASVTESIQQLTRLSKILADPVPSDDLKRMTSASMAETFTQFDIKHVTDKFPWASVKLQRRLGIINRLRRWRIRDLQIANREAIKEMSRALSFPPLGSNEVLDNFEALSFSDERTSTPTILDDWSVSSESDFTRSTSVSSAPVPKDGLFAPIAIRPQFYQQQAPLHKQRPVRKCAICFENIDFYMSEELWREHVLEDLEPYVCTVGTCAQSFCTFISKEDWMSHEFTEHHTLSSWSCRQCTLKFDSSEEFRQHMREDHTSEFLEHQLDSIVAFSKSIEQRCDFGVQCPLCKLPLKGLAETDAKHIGTHLEEIALFVLQSLSDISDGEEGLDEGNVLGTQGQTNSILGVGGLVIAFARCIEAFRIAISTVRADRDIDLLATQLSFQRMRLALWGEAVGLVSGSDGRTSTYNTNLYLPDIRPKLEGLLSSLSLQLAAAGKPSPEVSLELLTQSTGLCVFAEAYNRVYATISETVKPFNLETRVWSNKEVKMLPGIVHFLAKVMDNLEMITSSFMALERLHHELRNEVQAISEPSFLALIENAAVELPRDSTSHRTISDTASRCLEYVQSHGKPALDLALQDQNYGRALSVIKDEDMEYCQMGFGGLQHDTTTSPKLVAAKRILAELRNIWTGNIPFISVQLVGANIGKLLASIEGPPDTPYAGGVFWITVQMPIEDSFGIPRLKFHTKIYHPNIDVRGNICADNPASWDKVYAAGYMKKSSKSDEAQSRPSGDRNSKPAATVYRDPRSLFQTWTLSGLLIAICGLLASPNIHEPLVPEIARQYLDHYDWFCETARSVTLRYAIADRPPLDTLDFPKGIPVHH